MMKLTFRYISVMAVAAMALLSCTKQDARLTREIYVSFDNAAKSSLDGLQPKFMEGDRILVSNGIETEECTVRTSGGSPKITVSLTGTLKAVYPSSAAKLNGTDIEGIKVSTVQGGSFADANIAMASNVAGNAKSMTFTNMTAVFKITPGAGALTKYVEVITAGPEIANTASGEFTSMHKIHVATTSADSVYISILVPSGLRIRDLSFADGSRLKTAKDNTAAVTVNTIYTVDINGWNEPYVELAGMKWAIRNIGATSAAEYGDYFAWGATEKAYSSLGDGKFTFGSKPATYINTTWNAIAGFDWQNAVHTNGAYTQSNRNVFTKYTSYVDRYAVSGTADGKTCLEPADDVANAYWGGSWRMPSTEEFTALIACENEWDSDNVGYCFGTSPNRIFIPAAGYGNGVKLAKAGELGLYWGGSLNEDSPKDAWYLFFGGSAAPMTVCNPRYYGNSVRAVSE